MRVNLPVAVLSILLIASCSKNTDVAVPGPPLLPAPVDTTTVERMEFRWGIGGVYSTLSFVYYFQYDSAYRIKKSVLMDYVNNLNPPLPDTAFYRQYFYTGNDSLPSKLIYQYFPGHPDNFLYDTAYFTYDAARRLVADSGTAFKDIGYGIQSYYKRNRRINYPAADSLSITDTRQVLSGADAGSTFVSLASFKNIVSGNQQTLYGYRTNGTIAEIFTTRYDTSKNPFAKALRQIYPYFNVNGYDIQDGHIGIHFPQAFNRIFYQHKLMPSGGISHEYNYIITYNAQRLPVEIVAQPAQAFINPWQIKIYY
jgi:hypothetical protein